MPGMMGAYGGCEWIKTKEGLEWYTIGVRDRNKICYVFVGDHIVLPEAVHEAIEGWE